MPRDLDNYHPAYPKISEMLPVNPYRKKAETKKKKKGKEEDAGARNIFLEGKKPDKEINLYPPQKNEKQEYKVYEFGNYPYNVSYQGMNVLNKIDQEGSAWRPTN